MGCQQQTPWLRSSAPVFEGDLEGSPTASSGRYGGVTSEGLKAGTWSQTARVQILIQPLPVVTVGKPHASLCLSLFFLESTYVLELF